MNSMAAVDTSERGVGTNRIDESSAKHRELCIVTSGDDEDGHVELAEATPERLLRSGTAIPERCGQTLGAIGEPLGP